MFTDDIADDSDDRDIESRVSKVARKYSINRDDFRFFYYLLTNQETAKRVEEYVINFVEQEDGAVFREVNFAQREELLPRLDYNQTESKPILQYLSQITSIGVIGFNTNDLFCQTIQ